MPTVTHRIAPERWDAFVASHPDGNILQSHAWGTFKARWGWKVHHVVLVEGEHILAGAQLLVRPLPFGRSMLYVPRGPLIEDEQHLPLLLQGIHALAQREGGLVLTIEPPWQMTLAEATARLAPLGFRVGVADIQPRATIVIDLRPSLDEILARMKQKWRYNIRLSGRKGVTVRVGDVDDFAMFDALMQETGARDGFGVRPLAYYRDAWAAFQPDGSRLFIAEYDGMPLAALLAFRFGRVGYYLYGASSNRERQRMPNHALQWVAMQWAKENGCHWYDLWGIPPDVPDDGRVTTWGKGGLWGVYRFKRGFGGHIVKYPGAFDLVYNRFAYWLYRRRRRATMSGNT